MEEIIIDTTKQTKEELALATHHAQLVYKFKTLYHIQINGRHWQKRFSKIS